MLPRFPELFGRGFLASIVASSGNQKKTSILAIQQKKKLGYTKWLNRNALDSSGIDHVNFND